ncbi:MAG: oxygenase MpaB family protein [Salinimicrobium sediminis]|nr:oxygenase MpaB family protein [Salinimicrobium sediminis]
MKTEEKILGDRNQVNFVKPTSIVRQIWGKGDTILFIFAGAAAEFALNKAVDWLYFTGKLPADPLGRLFSTVSYARQIVFADETSALKAIDAINAIHANIEDARRQKIPDWAYRDVLFMLIDYSIRAFETMERQLNISEKEEVFDVFNRVGKRMRITGLPDNYSEWTQMRKGHLQHDLKYSDFTKDLYLQYRRHLGAVRYFLLLETQNLICPEEVRTFLGFSTRSALNPLLWIYKLCRYVGLDKVLKAIILPKKYKKEIRSLDVFTG